MPRLFTGVQIPTGIAERLSFLRGGLPGARWISTENYHLTLRFMGDIDMIAAEAIAEALSRVRRVAFSLRISGIGALGTRKPHAIVARVAPSPPLTELQAEHERLMQRHANARDIADYLTLRGGFATGPVEVDRFVLFSSRDSVGGGPYVVEEAYPLIPQGGEATRLTA